MRALDAPGGAAIRGDGRDYHLRAIPFCEHSACAERDGGPGLVVIMAEVAALIAEGASTPERARRLGVSVHTARHHGEQVFRELGVRSRMAVARLLGTPRDAGGGC